MSLMDRIDANKDEIFYWIGVALAVFYVWRAGLVEDDRDSLFLLFGAAFILIHAHGQRILAAVKRAPA